MRLSIRMVFGGLLLLGGMVAMTMVFGGDLARDVALRDEVMAPHPTARVIEAKCKNYYLLVSACSVEYEDLAAAKPLDRLRARTELNYLMFGSIRGERVVLMRPAKGEQIVTSSTGMAHLGNRIVTMLVLAGLYLFIPVAVLVKLSTSGRAPASTCGRLAALPEKS